ncbi:hypothetical protein MH139_18750, partial [Bacillus altitudinis]|uniref:hypothetical protein n=1 Tax=Bacillus altitudinis TaxID=293387 RepID=UPI002280A182
SRHGCFFIRKKIEKMVDNETDNHYHLVIERSYSLFPNPSIRSRSKKLGATPAKFFLCANHSLHA